MDLTEDEREKLDGSYKVAKKLERLQSRKQDQQQNSLGGVSDDINDGNESPNADGEPRSLDSQGSSEKTSPETSLIGSNGEKLCLPFFFHPLVFVNSIYVSSISGCPLSPSGSVRSPYSSLSLTASMQLVDEILSDQRIEKLDKIERLEAILSAATASSPSSIALSSSELSSSCCNCDCHSNKYVMQRDSLSGRYIAEVGCQTLSTGDIVITKVYFPEGDTSASEICLTPSPKKTKPAQFQ